MHADIAVETAITTLRALDSPADGVKPATLGRKEAMRFLVRRLMRKERTNNVRNIVANSLIGEAVS
jgi:hypothetical protein